MVPTTRRALHRQLLWGAGLALLLATVALAMSELTHATHDIATIWPTNAIILTALLRGRQLPPAALFAIGYAVDFALGLWLFDMGLRAAVMPVCNMVEIGMVYLLVRRRWGGALDLSRAGHLIGFSLVGGLLAPAVSGVLATLVISAGGDRLLLEVWPQWFLADALGMLVFVPLLMTVRPATLPALLRSRGRLRALGALAATALVTGLVFGQSGMPLLFLIFPLIVLAAFLVGGQGAAITTMLVVVVSFAFTAAGSGPLMLIDEGGLPAHLRLLVLQGLWLAAAAVAVPVATALAERERLDGSLAVTQRHLDSALSHMADGFMLVDAQGRIVLANPRMRALFPLTADQRVAGGSMAAVLEQSVRRGECRIEPPADLAASVAADEAEMRAGTRRLLAMTDGRWIELIATAMDGGGFVAVYRDVTGHKRAEQDLEASRARFATVIRIAPDGILITDTDGRIQTFNRAAEEIFGYAQDEVLGRNVAMLVPAARRSGAEAGPLEERAAGRPREVVGRRKNGALFPMELAVQPMASAGDTVFVGVFRDIGERKAMERELTRTLQHLDDAIESMPEGFTLLDSDERIVMLNERSRLLFPLTAALRRPGTGIADLVGAGVDRGQYAGGAADRDGVIALHLAIVRGGLCREIELLGDGRWIETSARPTSHGGTIVIDRDITLRKRLEQSIERRNQRLQAMNTELDQFASIAAHDLRAPLRQIGVLCGWLAKEIGEGGSAAVRQRLEQMHQRVQRMGALVDGLRAYAQAGGAHGPVALHALEPLAAAAIELAGGSGTQFEVAGPLPRVEAPEAALALVLRNLVGNAVKHHDRSDGRIRIRAEETDEEVVITVEDDGPGIPEAARAVAFDLFAQFRGDAARPGGIGLSLVRRAVAVHGGRVWAGPSSFGRGLAVHAAWPKPQRPMEEAA